MTAEGLDATGVLRQPVPVVGCYQLYFGGSAAFGYYGWVDANSNGLVVLEQKVTSGVDGRMQAILACYQERGRRGAAKNVQHMCDGNKLQMQRGGFFCVHGVLCVRRELMWEET